MNPRYVAAGATVAAALATPLVMHFEGKRNDPYDDAASPPIRTVCYGNTHNVQERHYTDAECLQQLREQLSEHDAGLMACISREIPYNVHAAFLSFAYNAGVAAVCKSQAVAKLNAGDFAGACAELSRWTKAGGRELPGLVKRRAAERALCERVDSAG